MIGVVEAQLKSKRRHQKAEKHRAAIAHENFRGLEIPSKEAGCTAENGGRQSCDQRLAVKVREHGEENRRHRRDAGAQAIHVIQDAEGCGDAHDPENGECRVQQIADVSLEEKLEHLRVNAAG